MVTILHRNSKIFSFLVQLSMMSPQLEFIPNGMLSVNKVIMCSFRETNLSNIVDMFKWCSLTHSLRIILCGLLEIIL